MKNSSEPKATAEPPEDPAQALDALPILIAVPHAARLLGISRTSAYRLAAMDELPCKRLGGRVYIITAKLKALVK